MNEESSYLVLGRDSVNKVLSEGEITILNLFIEKIRAYEGYKQYEVLEINSNSSKGRE